MNNENFIDKEQRLKKIKLLARVFHYALFAVFLISIFFKNYSNQVAGFYFIFSGLWMLAGCARKWPHIYCAFQSLRLKTLTPEKQEWTAKERLKICICGVILIGIGIFFAWFVKVGE